MPITPLEARNRLGAASRHGSPEEVAAARRELAAAKLEQYIARVVAEAPPLTDAQRDRIAGLLRPTKARDAA